MKAMVLCAGLGTRLSPVTQVWPKPAVPLLGAPLIRYALSTLRSAGITSVAINTHHLPEVMEVSARAECDRRQMALTVSRETKEILGTGGGIRALKHFLNDADFVVVNGDAFFSFDLAPAIAAHRASGACATLVLLPMPEGERFNSVEVDLEGRVRRIAGRGPGGERLVGWHFSGVHLMSPAVFDFMQSSGPEDINRDVYVRMLNAGLVLRGYVLAQQDTYWSDVGSASRYAAAHRHLLLGQVPVGRWGIDSPFHAMTKVSAACWAAESASFGAAQIVGPAWLGSECTLEPGVRLGAAVSVGPRAVVGRGAVLNRVAVLDGARVSPNSVLEDAIVYGDGQIVSALALKAESEPERT